MTVAEAELLNKIRVFNWVISSHAPQRLGREAEGHRKAGRVKKFMSLLRTSSWDRGAHWHGNVLFCFFSPREAENTHTHTHKLI